MHKLRDGGPGHSRGDVDEPARAHEHEREDCLPAGDVLRLLAGLARHKAPGYHLRVGQKRERGLHELLRIHELGTDA